jgi:hypothetical protein
MTTSNKTLTWIIIITCWLILQVIEILSTQNTLTIQIIGWIAILMVVLSLFHMEKDWKQKLKNGLFLGGITLMTTLFLISVLNHFYFNPKEESLKKNRKVQSSTILKK